MIDGLELIQSVTETQEENSLAPSAEASSDIGRLLQAVLAIEDIITNNPTTSNQPEANNYTISSSPTVSDILGYKGNLSAIVPAGFIMLHNDLTKSLKESISSTAVKADSQEEKSPVEKILDLFTDSKGFFSLFTGVASLSSLGSLLGIGSLAFIGGAAALTIIEGIKQKIAERNETVATGHNAAGEEVSVAAKEVDNLNWYTEDSFWEMIKAQFMQENLSLEQWEKFLEGKGIVDLTATEAIKQAYGYKMTGYLEDLQKEWNIELNKAEGSRNASVKASAAAKYGYDAAYSSFTSQLSSLTNSNLSSIEILEKLVKQDQTDTAQGIGNIAAEVLGQFGVVSTHTGGGHTVYDISKNTTEGYADAVVEALLNSFGIQRSFYTSERKTSAMEKNYVMEGMEDIENTAKESQNIVDSSKAFREIDTISVEGLNSEDVAAAVATGNEPTVTELKQIYIESQKTASAIESMVTMLGAGLAMGAAGGGKDYNYVFGVDGRMY